jgi:carbamoyl-phosphate synthase large subunit
VGLQIATVIAAVAGGFVLLQHAARRIETTLAVDLVRLTGSTRVTVVNGTGAVVVPHDGSPFLVVVSPSCSALASVLAIVCLAFLVPKTSLARRLGALGAAIALVVVGNIVRIAASLGAGVVSGRGTLVLFHDAVGSMFAFAYILGGYILMLYLLLPNDRAPRMIAADA